MKILIQKALKDGEALWPERFPPALLEKRREAMGSVIFNLQYQNDAGLAQGAIFREKWFRFYRWAPEGLAVYQGDGPVRGLLRDCHGGRHRELRLVRA